MKSALVGLGIFCALVLQMIGSQGTSAVGGTWSILDSKLASFDFSTCPTYVQKSRVEGYGGKQNVCVFGGDKMRVGSFSADGGATKLVIAFPLDTAFHPLQGICQGVDGCAYAPASDTLVARFQQENDESNMLIFRRFSERIQRLYNGGTDKVKFIFNNSSPDYILRNLRNNPASVGTVAVSGNGKWAVTEEKEVGFTVINLATFETRRIYRPGYLNGLGTDSLVELAISNDGMTIVVTGENAGFTMIETNSACGGLFAEECRLVMPDLLNLLPAFYFGAHPVFDKSGEQLSFYAASVGLGTRRVVLQKPGLVATTMKYLALGDSFTSGEGETSNSFYKVGTNDGVNHCHVSVRSYAFLIGMGPDVQSVACSGAKITDVVGNDDSYLGQGKRLLDDKKRTTKQHSALDSFMPGWIHQESFVNRYKPEVVTLGIGGNDAGFMTKLKTCAMPGTCEWVSTPEGRLGTAKEIQRLFYELVGAYKVIMSNSPKTSLYAVGYPQIMGENMCDPVTFFLFSHEERAFVRQGISYINQIIKAAARSVGATYLDVEDSLEGYELCGRSIFSSAVNAIRLGGDIALIQSLPMLKIVGSETFHPTPEGHKLLARAITGKYGDLSEQHSCNDCPASLEPPPLPDYWTRAVAPGAETATQSAGEFIEDNHISPSKPIVKLAVGPFSFEPGSFVKIEIHSESLELGRAQVGDDGGFSSTFKISRELPEGFHTIHIYGTSYSHEPVDLYQLISYGDGGESDTSSSVDQNPSLAILGTTMFNEPKDGEVLHRSRNLTKDQTIGYVLLIAATLGIVITGFILSIWKRKQRSHKNSTQDPDG